MRYRPPAANEIVLARHEGRLEARGPADRPGSGVRAEWPAPEARRGGSALLRAIGEATCVIDATAGLGVDAWTLACAGRRVIAIERSPIAAQLLSDALDHARDAWPEAAARFEIRQGDARTLLPTATAALRAGGRHAMAICLDPMFPPKRRESALPSKSMQFLASIAGDDADAAELLAVARACGAARVVVKRPPHAPTLAPGPAYSIESKLLRFDVYLPASDTPSHP